MLKLRNINVLKEYGKEVLVILGGCALYAVSMALIDHVSTIPGNMMGIAVVCHTLFDWPIGLVNVVISIPTIIIGTLVIGKKMLIYTVIAMTGVSALIDWWVPIFSYTPTNGPLIPTILSGLVMGVGCGMMIYAGATTGGTTILGRLLLLKFPNMKLGNLLIMMDGVIIAAGAVAMRDWQGFVYSIIFEVVVCKTIDASLYCLRKCFSDRW